MRDRYVKKFLTCIIKYSCLVSFSYTPFPCDEFFVVVGRVPFGAKVNYVFFNDKNKVKNYLG